FESRWVRLTEPEPAEVVGARLRGRRITNVRRRGKFVVFDLDGGEALVVSLRMTGKLLYGVADVDERYVRGEIRFVDGTAMRFSDTRKFGRMAVIDAATLEGTGDRRRAKMPLHASLGPEPLGRGITGRMQREFQVYSRAGEPCPRCGREIVRTVVGGRGTFHCPRCQRAPRG